MGEYEQMKNIEFTREELLKELQDMENAANSNPHYNPRYFKAPKDPAAKDYYEGYMKAITDLRRFITGNYTPTQMKGE